MDRTFRRALYLAAGAHLLALIVARVTHSSVDASTSESLETTTTTTDMIELDLGREEGLRDLGAPASITGTPGSPQGATGASDPAPSPNAGIVTTPRPKIPEPTSAASTTASAQTTAQTDPTSTEPPTNPSNPQTGEGETTSGATTSGNGTTPYLVPELGKKSSWLLPPLLPNAVGAAGTASSLDPISPQKKKEDALAAKVSKDVIKLVDAETNKKTGGAGGPVIGAAHAAAHDESLAPTTGIAIFEVKTDASGSVKSVTVLSNDGDGPGWNVVAIAIKKELGTKKLVVPSGANGLKVTVRVQAKFALPSGATGSGVSPYVSGIGGGFGFDVSDIGQKPMRVVAVTEIDESRL